MKAPLVIGAVVVVHCLAVGSVILNQGCGGTLRAGNEAPPPEPKLPPAEITREVPLPNRSPVNLSTSKEVQAVASADVTEYTIQSGDSLSLIAARYGLRVSEIASLNGIQDVSKVRTGMKILLPGKVDLKASKPVEVRKPAPAVKSSVETGGGAVSGGNVHVVKKGEMLSKIAASYHVKTADLMKANNLSSDRIRVGQKLTIPGDGGVAAALLESPVPAETKEPKPKAAAVTVPPAVPEKSAVIQAPPAVDASTGPKDSGRTHVVEGNEDIYSVSMLWGVDVESLKALNNLKDTNLKPGQKLKIPVSE